MVESHNEGISVSGGGVINAKVIAVGYQARAELSVATAGDRLEKSDLNQVKVELERLMAALKTDSARLENPEPVFGVAERVASELAQPKPDKLTLKGLLSAIVDETKSVAQISGAAMSLMSLISSVF